MDLPTILLILILLWLIYNVFIINNKLNSLITYEHYTDASGNAINDEAVQTIASLYNSNGTLTIPNLHVTGTATIDNGVAVSGGSNYPIVINSVSDDPYNGNGRILFRNKNGSQYAWFNGCELNVDNKRSLNILADKTNMANLGTNNITVAKDGINVTGDVNVSGNINTKYSLNADGPSAFNGCVSISGNGEVPLKITRTTNGPDYSGRIEFFNSNGTRYAHFNGQRLVVEQYQPFYVYSTVGAHDY